MSTRAPTLAVPSRPHRAAQLRTAHLGGVLAVVGGVSGAAAATVLILVPPVVPATRFSYPLDAAGHVAVQTAFFIHHLVVAAALLAVWRAGLAGRSRWAAASSIAATALMALLGIQELLVVSQADADTTAPTAQLLSAVYGVLTMLLGLALVAMGVAVGRAGVLDPVGRWVVLAAGIYLFVPLTPAIFGPFVVARLAIGGWLLLFAALGGVMLGWAGRERGRT